MTYGVDHAYSVARERAGAWFDPSVVLAAGAFRKDHAFWAALRECPQAHLDQTLGAANHVHSTDVRVDSVCDAFAGIVDAKSSFTAAHSRRVAKVAVGIATQLELGPAAERRMYRAGLLHDLGKLAAPNLILDKPGPLTEQEFEVVQRHPFYTDQILRNIPGFARISETAAAHHEKLDGSGYHRGLLAESMNVEMRILAVADIYDALAAERPYRSALPADRVHEILQRDARYRLDADCVSALTNQEINMRSSCGLV
jgi:HD-GYP domain-containing protein (c-di-GMP phosphodiesterase class II)